MKKNVIIGLMFSLSCSLFAVEDFNVMKSHLLDRVNDMRGVLNKTESCIQGSHSKDDLNRCRELRKAEMNKMREEHKEEMNKIREEHKEEMGEIREDRKEEMNKIREEHKEEMGRIREDRKELKYSDRMNPDQIHDGK
jgi:DNA anti-recombination protein RmuC